LCQTSPNTTPVAAETETDYRGCGWPGRFPASHYPSGLCDRELDLGHTGLVGLRAVIAPLKI
jgi:hypothetical protein